MGRIDDIFARARSERRRLVLPFFTAGDPDLATTTKLLTAARRAGAEIAELGIPFSDPIADGPVIAQSMHASLQRGVTPRAILEEIGRGAKEARPALLAMVSASIALRAGVERFVADAAGAGFAGLIVPDVDIADAAALTRACDARGLACAYLVAPTTTTERLRVIVPLCRGFVYLLARAGVTGERREMPDIGPHVEAIRAVAPTLPIAAGFGISTPEHVRQVVRHADGAIIGSALVRTIAEEVAAKRDPTIAIERALREMVGAAGER